MKTSKPLLTAISFFLLSFSQSGFAEVCKGKGIFGHGGNANTTEIILKLEWAAGHQAGRLQIEIPEVLKDLTLDSNFTKVKSSESTYEFHNDVNGGLLQVVGTFTANGYRHLEGALLKQNAGEVTFVVPELKCE